MAVQVFIQNDKPIITGLVLAGSADFKHELNTSNMFDPRLNSKVIKMVDVSYGGENGLNQAIELSQESLQNVKFVQEKQLISKFFQEIAMDTGKFCSGSAKPCDAWKTVLLRLLCFSRDLIMCGFPFETKRP